ncbi:MAG: methyltransferase domain-containing protein [Planctomycetota bacterium]|nr:methyltransferase domain-containing protein [Planctomycetota bacterium]
MKQRELVPELMDDPQLDRLEHQAALEGLKRINAWTGNPRLAWSFLRKSISKGPVNQKLSLLDVATGSADIPIAIHRLSTKTGQSLSVTASDISVAALLVARQQAWNNRANIELIEHDVVQNDIEGKFDFVMSSQFLHHLNENEVVTVLKRMRSAARRKVIVIDLHRSWMNFYQVWLATRLLSRSRVVHFDGPQSIRAAFTLKEFEKLAVRAGFRDFELSLRWPCRFVFCGKGNGTN